MGWEHWVTSFLPNFSYLDHVLQLFFIPKSTFNQLYCQHLKDKTYQDRLTITWKHTLFIFEEPIELKLVYMLSFP